MSGFEKENALRAANLAPFLTRLAAIRFEQYTK